MFGSFFCHHPCTDYEHVLIPWGKDLRSCLAEPGLMRRNKIRQPHALCLLTFPFCVCARWGRYYRACTSVFIYWVGRMSHSQLNKSWAVTSPHAPKNISTQPFICQNLSIQYAPDLQLCKMKTSNECFSNTLLLPHLILFLSNLSLFWKPLAMLHCHFLLFLFKPKVEHSPQTGILQSVDLVID